MRWWLGVAVIFGAAGCAASGGDGGQGETGGDGETGGSTATTGTAATSAGPDELVGTTHVDGVDTRWTCDVQSTPATLAAIEVAGSTRRLRLACLELVPNLGQHMFSVIVERTTDFTAGTQDVGRPAGSGTGDTLGVVLTDGDGDGYQFITSSTSGWSGWEGVLRLDEVGGEGGGTVRGSLTASWQTMQEMQTSAPVGDPVDRPGTLAVSFDFARP